MKRLLGIAVIASLAWACGGPNGTTGSPSAPAGATPVISAEPPPADATEFTFWTFVPRHADWWAARAADWNEANPDQPIAIVPTVTEYTQMHDNLTAALTSGTGAPELVDIEIGKFANYTKGTVHLVDMTAEADAYVADLVATRLAPYQVDGTTYAVDYHLGAVLAFYNRELLEAADVDPASIVTWDDYIEAGKKVQAATPGVTFAAIDTNGPIPVRSLMLQAGGGSYDEGGTLILNSDENVEALQLIADMVTTHKIAAATPGGNNGTPEFYQAMQDGQFASVWMPQWYMTRFPDNMASLCGKMVIGPMPLLEEGGFTTTMQGGTGTAVTDQTAAEKQQLAKDFVTWAKLTKDGQISIWNELGFDPFRPDVYEEESLREPDPCFSDQITFDVIKSELGNVAPEYTGPVYPQIQDYLNTTLINDVVNNGVSPADALNAAQEAMEAAS